MTVLSSALPPALWTSNDAVIATGGQSAQPWQASGISIDTRTIAKGDLFVALKDARDGHEFVAAALKKGAAAALVSHIPDGVPKDAPLLIVKDVLQALEGMAKFARARSRAKVVGVTGSVGKTSTKEMLRTVLGLQGTVHAAESSFNNHWGVPVTLARMPIDVDFAVIEIGMNHPGEIEPLARLARPHVAMITNIEAAHLHAFKNLEGIAREKAAIFAGLQAPGTAIINADQQVTPILRDIASQHGANIVTFGVSESADFRLLDVQLAEDATVARAQHGSDTLLFKIPTLGRHFAQNAIGVLAVADTLGCDVATTALDLGQWTPPAGRGTKETLVLDIVDDHLTFGLLDDAFNANPASMAAALEVLGACKPANNVGRVSNGRRIAILGDMLELGATEIQLHKDIAKRAAFQSLDLIHCVGPRMRALYDVLPMDRRGEWCETAIEMAAQAHHLFDAGDVVLVKGSKGSKVSLVVDAIRKLGHRQPPKE